MPNPGDQPAAAPDPGLPERLRRMAKFWTAATQEAEQHGAHDQRAIARLEAEYGGA